MPRSTSEILEDIRRFSPSAADDNWSQLDELLDELWTDGDPRAGLGVLFEIFERFPEHDGHGVFWTILHGIESIEGYEIHAVRAVRRAPTEFSLQLVNRLIRSGRKEVEGISLLALLEEIANDERRPDGVREWASSFLEEHL